VGVGLAIALAVTMFSLTEGVRASTRDLVDSSGIDVFLYPKGTNPLYAGNPNAPAGELSGGRALADSIANEKGVQLAAPMLHEEVYALANGKVSDANALGIVPRTTQQFLLPPFTQGHAMQVLDDPARYDIKAATGELVINENLARILGVGPGDAIRLSRSPANATNDLVFHVSGVTSPTFESPREKTVYVHLSELQRVTDKTERDTVDFIGIKVEPGADVAALARRLEASQPVEAFTNDDLVREVGTLTKTFEGFAQMIGVVTLGVALLFVATVMIVVVNERTGELGALRAMGLSRASVFRLVLAEAAILVAIAAVVGFALGYAGALGFDAFLRGANAQRTPAGFHFTKFSWPLLLQVSGLTAVMALASGLLPAWRATKIDIIAALRSV
jgi:ABC-type lipoprotein release transport system permease subunit